MNGLKEKIAYLQGLAEGIELAKESKEGKLMTAIIDVLEEMALAIEGITLNQNELERYLEALDDDLGDVEDDLYGEDGEYLYEDDDYEDVEDTDDYAEECECADSQDFVEIACPHCLSVINFEPEIIEDDDVPELTCPNCNEVIYVNEAKPDMQDKGEEKE